ncbi:HEPN domain-containing protein [Pyrobaculum aerophilum]|uniref:HEPN domain-containing protein n=1 Tax=Pyrobaculum aerophilum TaxID=13773 RepID=UPI002163F9D2|nr:HEPN domain-containing protein [Pyrobaculum aerophilum]
MLDLVCTSLERALQFYEQATFTLENCEMLFNIEQALQLYMKYLLYRKIGDYPKSHFLRDIADRLVEIYQDNCGVKDHVKRWGQILALLE